MHHTRLLRLLIGILVAVSGCASFRTLNEAEQLEALGDYEAAYELLLASSEKRPDDQAIAEARDRVASRLAQEYRQRAQDLPDEALRRRIAALTQSLKIDPSPSPAAAADLESAQEELDSILTEIDSAAALSPVDQLKLAWRLRAYRGELQEVDEYIDAAALKTTTYADALRALSKPAEALALARVGERLWSSTLFARLRDDLIQGDCSRLADLADRYAAIPNGARSATAAFLQVARVTYCGEGAEEAIDALGHVLETYRVSIAVEGPLIDLHRSEFENRLKGWQSLNSFRLVDPRETEPNVVAGIEVRDIGIEIDEAQEIRFSKFRSGYRQEANPTYQQLLVELQDAQVALQNAVAIVPTTPFLQGWKIGAVAAASARVNKLRQAVIATPPYIQVPVYSDYQYELRTVVLHPLVELRVSLWDTRDRIELFRETINRSDRVTKQIAIGVHPDDSDPPLTDPYSEDTRYEVLEEFRRRTFAQTAERVARALRETNLRRAEDSLRHGYFDSAREFLLAYATQVWIGAPPGAWPQRVARILSNHSLGKLIDGEVLEAGEIGNVDTRLNLRRHLELVREMPLFTTDASSEMSRRAFGDWDPLVFRFRPKSKLVSARAKQPPKSVHRQPYNVSLPAPSKRRPDLPIQDIVRFASGSVVVIESPSGSGSGFVVRESGLIVTNEHVVEDAAEVNVNFPDGTKTVGQVLARSHSRDLALVQVPIEGLKALPLRPSAEVETGEGVVAIGAPYGFAQTVTSGIVSAVRRGQSLTSPDSQITWVQTDAAINKGNSGGPLLNRQGEVIAVNTLGFAPFDAEGFNFSVATDEILLAFPERFSY